jgi:co-chaperonin GroES (HSP10)
MTSTEPAAALVPAATPTPTPTKPSARMPAGHLRLRLRPGNVAIKRSETPEWTASGVLVIPDKYRDQPMEGVVVAVGLGREYEPQFCMGLQGESFEACGQRATHRLVGLNDCDELHLLLTADEEGEQPLRCGWRQGHIGPHTDARDVDPHTRDVYEPMLRVCSACLMAHNLDSLRPPMVARPLLTNRPVEVAVGDRVVFSKWAGSHPTMLLGEELIITDDVLGIVAPGTPLVIRREAV